MVALFDHSQKLLAPTFEGAKLAIRDQRLDFGLHSLSQQRHAQQMSALSWAQALRWSLRGADSQGIFLSFSGIMFGIFARILILLVEKIVVNQLLVLSALPHFNEVLLI